VSDPGRGQEPTTSSTDWYAATGAEVAATLSTDLDSGLSSPEARRRLQETGPNSIATEAPPGRLRVALGQLRDPMTLMLVVVAVVSIVIGQSSTAMVVVALVVLNVALGTNQELKARASVEALASLQVPEAKVLRDSTIVSIPASEVVPGDVVAVEAGDIVPADGRIIASATLETQEAALTGESAPVAKGPAPVHGAEVPLGDRSSMLFQNTSVTRGSGRFVVTETGMLTQVGRIATMVTAVRRTRSPLQLQLDGLTRAIGFIAWGALAVILVVGLVRGLPFADLMLLGVSMAISAIPTGMPTFVQTMLATGARQLAGAKAIVRNLTDVETLGATSHINTDKTGTLTLNQMTVRAVYAAGQWFEVQGEGYATTGDVRGVAGAEPVDLTPLAYVGALTSDAVVGADGAVVGDPTELAVVVLAEKLGVSVAETRRAYPRVATVPFDSDYKFMATFHRLPFRGEAPVLGLVKGGPDVVLARCSRALSGDGVVPIEEVRAELEQVNTRLGEHGLRVLAAAARVVPEEDVDGLEADPMGQVHDLILLGLVGIIDPLRPDAVEAVRIAHAAGIDVRMITGDHLVTAGAIGRELGLGAGAMTGAEFAAASDEEILRRLDGTHVFGRVSPQDKLRLVQLMQSQGHVVAMTGDAVNDAAALKQADIGVAMGSGSEVSKQAAKMILTDDNFATLVRAVGLGRSIYNKVTAYIGYQMSQLFALVIMFLLATAFNVNDGVAMLPLQVLFLNFAVAVVPIIIISLDPPDPEDMQRPPRDPSVRIFNRTTGIRWITLGLLLGGMALATVAFGPGEPSIDGPSTPVTMGFVVVGLGTAVAGFVMHRNPGSSFARPVLVPALWTLGAVAVMIAATEVAFLRTWLDTVELTTTQWWVCIGAALVFGAVVELDKAWQRTRARGGAS
jgi:Ca2+-transporting ATPase